MPYRFRIAFILVTIVISALVFCFVAVPVSIAQGCGADGPLVLQPIVNPTETCPEYLVRDLPVKAMASVTTIAYAPACDGENSPAWCERLFYVRPDEGAVYWVGEFNADSGAYDIRQFAEGLDWPSGLAWYGDTLFVAGYGVVYALQDTDGDGAADAIATIIEHLPTGAGQWMSAIAIGPDERLYVGQGTACNACEPSDERIGTVQSYELDGSDEQVAAQGLRTALGFDWQPATGDLWITDNGRQYALPPPLDEINRILDLTDHFGWPYCYTADAGIIADFDVPHDSEAFCASTQAPIITLPVGSMPGGLAFYEGDAFPHFQDDLLVVLQGTDHGFRSTGFAVMRYCLDAEGEPEPCFFADGQPVLAPGGESLDHYALLPFDPSNIDRSLHDINIQNQGFHPEHPIGIAVSPDGLIAVSIREGKVIQLIPPGG